MSRATTNPTFQPQTTGKSVAVTQEMIAKRAYEKWLQRGRPEGTTMQDWLEAEMELRRETPTATNYRGT